MEVGQGPNVGCSAKGKKTLSYFLWNSNKKTGMCRRLLVKLPISSFVKISSAALKLFHAYRPADFDRNSVGLRTRLKARSLGEKKTKTDVREKLRVETWLKTFLYTGIYEATKREFVKPGDQI
jgi:hypothetical protein